MNRPIYQCFLKGSFTELDKKLCSKNSLCILYKKINMPLRVMYCKYCKQSRKIKIRIILVHVHVHILYKSYKQSYLG